TEIPNVNSMKPFASGLLPIVGRQAEDVDDDMQACRRVGVVLHCETVVVCVVQECVPPCRLQAARPCASAPCAP
ncbi:hypothetical protein THAOC_16238, partial [Thalassiosira oceanica]